MSHLPLLRTGKAGCFSKKRIGYMRLNIMIIGQTTKEEVNLCSLTRENRTQFTFIKNRPLA
jgi:hypothetical protein